MSDVILKKLQPSDMKMLWQIGFSQPNPEWSKWDGPYFDDYKHYDTFESFQESELYHYLLRDNKRGIYVNDELIGVVTYYWECKATRWLEIGIVIYSPSHWNGGYGKKALRQWVTWIFDEIAELEHIGLTTWSGNIRMMRLSESLGFTQEACIRKVRYWQNHYYDSVKYGVLREEWIK